MRRPPEVLPALVVVVLLVPGRVRAAERTEATTGGGFLDGRFGGRKEPITVTSDTLEYDYRRNVVVYRGDVQATQGQVKVRSDRLTVTLEGGSGGKEARGDGARLREIVAEGNVRIDNGLRWATGGRATFDQHRRTLVLTDDPKLHDGSNEVAGERVVVYLDEDRSVVEGGRRRVKAVLYPGRDGGLAPGAAPADGDRPAAGESAAGPPGPGAPVP
jgi:lipopolysaccharide export system protein LptA